MGLLCQHQFELRSGLVLQNVYVKLANIVVQRDKQFINIHCGFEAYLTREAMQNSKSPIESMTVPPNITFPIAAENFTQIDLFKWCYLQYKNWLNDHDLQQTTDVLEDGQSSYESVIPVWQPSGDTELNMN